MVLPSLGAESKMKTVFDWVTLAAFAGLVVLFLQRSMEEEPSDNMLHYLPPSIGCALANWLGNHDNALAAIAVLIASAAYVWVVLKPVQFRR